MIELSEIERRSFEQGNPVRLRATELETEAVLCPLPLFEEMQRKLRELSADSHENEDGPMSPPEIARILAAMERIEPFAISDDEQAEFEAWEKKIKEYTIANMEKGNEDVFR